MTRSGRNGVDKEKIRAAIYMVLEAIGEDPKREGLRETPERVANYFEEMTSGLHRDPLLHLDRVFNEGHEEMVIVKDIAFHSICEHHLLPFVGKAHVAYIPREGRVVGLSKLARVVEDFSRRPQLQERLTTQVVNALMERIEPHGALVVIEAEHMCMTMRGVRKPGAKTITSAVRGTLADDAKSRMEAMALIKGLTG